MLIVPEIGSADRSDKEVHSGKQFRGNYFRKTVIWVETQRFCRRPNEKHAQPNEREVEPNEFYNGPNEFLENFNGNPMIKTSFPVTIARGHYRRARILNYPVCDGDSVCTG